MSTETTNKKIKIDNGTTFGRTYTDKAVDELLSSVGGGIPVVEGTFNSQTSKITISEAQTRNFILHTSEYGYIYMNVISGGYFGGVTQVDTNGEILIIAFVSDESSLNTIGMEFASFNSNDIPDIPINIDNLINVVHNYGVDNIDFSNVTKTKILCIRDDKSFPTKIYPLYYINESKYEGFGIVMHNNITDLETYTLSITNNIGKITTVTSGFKSISLFGKHSILVPKDSADNSILSLPADASTSTYVLKAVNGTVQWVKES